MDFRAYLHVAQIRKNGNFDILSTHLYMARAQVLSSNSMFFSVSYRYYVWYCEHGICFQRNISFRNLGPIYTLAHIRKNANFEICTHTCTRLGPRPFLQIEYFLQIFTGIMLEIVNMVLFSVTYFISEVRAYLHVVVYCKTANFGIWAHLCTRLGPRLFIQCH